MLRAVSSHGPIDERTPPAARGGIVAPTLTSLVALVLAASAHPGDPPVVVLSTPLVFIVGYQLHHLGGYAWGLLERRHETRLTSPV